MGYSAKVILDSVGPSGKRLTTFEVTFPRIVLAEFNTHRLLSRNSASSRAIPVERRIAAIETDPFIPESFGRNQKGMQASELLNDSEAIEAHATWLSALEFAIAHARKLARAGVHKQLANRLIEPFCWHTVIVSATEWDHYFGLRCNTQAQPEIQRPSYLMREARDASAQQVLRYGDWHLPFVNDEDRREFDVPILRKLSTARCARVSYLTHDGRRAPEEDIVLHDKLAASGHWSPFEHVAEAILDPKPSGNFIGWFQYRKMFANEHIGGARS